MHALRLVLLVSSVAASARAGDLPVLPVGPLPYGPVVVTQEVYHKVKVKRPVTETLLVPETVTRKVVRQVYRKAPGTHHEQQTVLVPEKRQELRTRMTYQETKRRVLETRLEYVPEKKDELQTRQVYRQEKGKEVRTRMVLVPIKTQKVQTRMVYAEKSVQVTRMALRIRMIDAVETDPVTGLSVRVQKPVCYQEPVVETVKTYALEPRQSVETVTEYRLEPRTESVDSYVLSTECVPTRVTTYRPEMRTRPREVKEYHLVPKTAPEEVTHYRHETRLVPKTEYCLVWEEALVEEKVYRCRTRTELREVDIVLRCHGEAVRTAPPTHPVAASVQQPIGLPCDCRGAALGVQGGGFAAFGATSQAPPLR